MWIITNKSYAFSDKGASWSKPRLNLYRKRTRGSRDALKAKGILFQPSGCSIWYCQFYKDGKQIRESTGTHIKQEALAIMRRKMGRSEQGLMSDSQLRKVRYADLRAGLLANYSEKGNRTLYQTADGAETIGGLKALDEFFGFSEKNPGPTVLDITHRHRPTFRQEAA